MRISGDRPLFFLVTAIAVLLGIELMDGRASLIQGGDSSSYILLAKALATGQGYSDINIPGSPPHTQYPPGFPLLLSVVYHFSGFNMLWMKLVSIVSGIASVFLIMKLFGRDDFKAGAAIALLTCTSFYFLVFMREVAPEVPYLFISLLALVFLERYLRREDGHFDLLFLLFVLAWACLTKMIGITLYAAGVAVLAIGLLKKDQNACLKRLLYFSVLALLPFALWMLRGGLLAKGVDTYSSIFLQADYYSAEKGLASAGSILSRVGENLGYYYQSVPMTLIPYSVFSSIGPVTAHALRAVMLAVLVPGFLHKLYSRRSPADFYVLFYFALLLIWPTYGPGDSMRYLVPVMPFLYFYLLSGSSLFSRIAMPSAQGLFFKGAFVAPFIILLGLNLFEIRERVLPGTAYEKVIQGLLEIRDNYGKRIDAVTPEIMAIDHFKIKSPCFSEYMESVFMLRKVLREGDVILARKPEVVSVITGSYAVRFPFTGNGEAMMDFMKKNRATYVILDTCYPEADRYLRPVLILNEKSFRPVLSGAGTIVLKVSNPPLP